MRRRLLHLAGNIAGDLLGALFRAVLHTSIAVIVVTRKIRGHEESTYR